MISPLGVDVARLFRPLAGNGQAVKLRGMDPGVQSGHLIVGPGGPRRTGPSPPARSCGNSDQENHSLAADYPATEMALV